ncbi:MAG: GMC family oxidoreductase N-terminal domain-containing protein [Pseudomonadota bacterium]
MRLGRRQFVARAASLAALFPAACSDVSQLAHEYDVIIVGGGSAGCVLARRLTDNPNTQVLLIEAGGPAQHPALNSGLKWFSMLGSDLAYPDMTLPQASLGGKQIFAAHGRALGGSSVINAMIHHWPAAADIDQWNVPGWGWADIQPMLAASETYLDGPSPGRGTQGPIGVMRLPDPPALTDAALEAAQARGFGMIEDINSGSQIGAAHNQLAFADGMRQHTGLAYLEPVGARRNLTVMVGAQAAGLILSGQSCNGVIVESKEGPRRIGAGRTVLSAGALRTPQLLMLSGIGPADHLRSLEIDVALDQPAIGANLHDHLLFSGNNFAATGSGASEYHGSAAVLYASSGQGRRDILCNISTNARVFPPLESADSGFKTSFSFTKPHSRGVLRLVNKDPAKQPLLDHRFLSDERDVVGALAALDTSRSLLSHSAFSRFDAKELNQDMLSTPDGRRAFLNASATSFGHHCGTCAMGIEAADPVAPDLSLRGIKGLSVMDASILPSIPSSPTNALVVAMAELAAQRLAA